MALIVDDDVVSTESDVWLSLLGCNNQRGGNRRITSGVHILTQALKFAFSVLIQLWILLAGRAA